LFSRNGSGANAESDTVSITERLADSFPHAERIANAVSVAESDGYAFADANAGDDYENDNHNDEK
jgi:hypothetical protein